MADISDYEDAVRRIVNADVDPESVTRASVLADLAAVDDPQVTKDVAQNLADAVVTTEDVVDALASTDEIPTEGEIEAATGVADNYDMGDRVDGVADVMIDETVTVEDVREATEAQVDAVESSGRIPTKDDVRQAATSVEGEVVAGDPEDMVDEIARDLGTPDADDLNRERAQTIAQADQIEPREVVEDTNSTTPVQVVRDGNGDPVVATGGASRELGEAVADEVGVEYRDRGEVVDSFDVRGRGSTVDLTLEGSKVGEVDI